jgi:hypothetical protein
MHTSFCACVHACVSLCVCIMRSLPPVRCRLRMTITMRYSAPACVWFYASLFVFTYVCMYVCKHAYMLAYICIYVYIYIYIYIYNICIHVYVHIVLIDIRMQGCCCICLCRVMTERHSVRSCKHTWEHKRSHRSYVRVCMPAYACHTHDCKASTLGATTMQTFRWMQCIV